MSTANSVAERPIKRVTSEELKKYLKAGSKPSRVISPVERYMLVRKQEDDRRQDILHPSEISQKDWCIRESFFKIRNAREGQLAPKEAPGLRLQSIFDVGHAVHAKWQGYLAEMGMLWGSWKCGHCGARQPETGPLPTINCVECGSLNRWVYDELGLFDDDYLISGSTDGLVMGDKGDFLLEIKSIGTGTFRTYDPAPLIDADGNLEKAFESLRRPFLGHRRQGQLYLTLANMMFERGDWGRPEPPQEIAFLYECKANQAYKEFTVQWSRESVKDILDTAEDLVWYLDKDRAPECNQSKTGSCKKCSAYNEEAA